MPNIFFRSPDDNAAGADPASTGNTPKTDNTKLVVQRPYVSVDQGASELTSPAPNTPYSFYADVTNGSTLNSDPFFVRFTLDYGEGNDPAPIDFQQQAGLAGGQSVKAVVQYGGFDNVNVTLKLTACIFSSSAPETPISCSPYTEINVFTPGTDSGNTQGTANDGGDTVNTTPPADSGDNSNQGGDNSGGNDN